MTQLKDKAFTAISDYLLSCGWVQEYRIDDGTFFYLRDPLTQGLHRSDMAWFIQTEREAYDVIRKHEPPTPLNPPSRTQLFPHNQKQLQPILTLLRVWYGNLLLTLINQNQSII